MISSITENPAFPYLVAVIVIILLGIGYYLLDKYKFSKMEE